MRTTILLTTVLLVGCAPGYAPPGTPVGHDAGLPDMPPIPGGAPTTPHPRPFPTYMMPNGTTLMCHNMGAYVACM